MSLAIRTENQALMTRRASLEIDSCWQLCMAPFQAESELTQIEAKVFLIFTVAISTHRTFD
jgi:hypothetical protein